MSQNIQIRWWARFAVRSSMARAGRVDRQSQGVPGGMSVYDFLLMCEREPMASLVDVTDCCVSNRVSAEVWYEEYDGFRADERTGGLADLRVHAGWIDELGRLHARRKHFGAARGLALVIASNGRKTSLKVSTFIALAAFSASAGTRVCVQSVDQDWEYDPSSTTVADGISTIAAQDGGNWRRAWDPSGYDIEESAHAIELWAHAPRREAHEAGASVYPFHRFLVGTIHVG